MANIEKRLYWKRSPISGKLELVELDVDTQPSDAETIPAPALDVSPHRRAQAAASAAAVAPEKGA